MTNQTQHALKQARQNVLAQTQILQNLIPPTVSYTTEGTVLIIGPGSRSPRCGQIVHYGKSSDFGQ